MANEATQTDAGASGQQQTTNPGAQATQTAQTQQTQGQPGQQTTQQQTSSDPSRTGAQSGFTYQEDRSRWIPPHRLNEETTKRQTLEAELAQARRQVQALTGVQPTDPNTQKAEQIREAFFNLPGMGIFRKFMNMSEEQLDRVFSLPENVSRVQDNEAREFARMGRQNLSTIYDSVAEVMGAEKLSEDQKSDLQTSFVNWFRGKCEAELQASGGKDSPTLQRYEDADPTLLSEFVDRFTKGWVDPARRKVTQTTLSRTRAVPNSGGRSQVSQVTRPQKFDSLDQRIEYASNLLKERGVQFGR